MRIKKIFLTNFRNFSSKKIDFISDLVLLVGENGVGKTNILEALTVIGRNTSLRGDDFEEMVFEDDLNKRQNFTIYTEISDHEFIEKVGILFDLRRKKKIIEINGEALNSKRQGDLKKHLINFVFLTPQLEQLFISGKAERRDYLDKIVSDLDLEHSSRVNAYQRLLKERLLILQKHGSQKSSEKWLDVIEDQIVELGVAIASARIEAVGFFNRAILSFSSKFPKPELLVIGEVEELVLKQSAVSAELEYRLKLKENRAIDLASFKTSFGVHRSDFDAIFREKNASATRSSTGEQKSIMIGITLARAKISATYKNQSTVLIFDEVASHLDEKKRNELFAEISNMSLQTFFSATSADLIPSSVVENNLVQIVRLN